MEGVGLAVPLQRAEGVRVREASALRLGELSVQASVPALVERLREDRWPLVRAVWPPRRSRCSSTTTSLPSPASR